jgi:hypothetical protein
MKVLTIGGAMIDTIAIVDSGRIERMSMSNAHWGKAAVTQTSSDVAV